MRTHWLLAFAIVNIVLIGDCAEGVSSNAAFSMPIEEFRRLDIDDQRELIRCAFEHRLQLGKNVYFEAVMLGKFYEYKDGEIGHLIGEAFGRKYRYWRLKDSYRMETDSGDKQVLKPKIFNVTGFDASTGIVTTTSKETDTGRKRALIDVKESLLIGENHYLYWFDGFQRRGSVASYIISEVLQHIEEMTIDASNRDGRVRIMVPWVHRLLKNAVGERHLILGLV